MKHTRASLFGVAVIGVMLMAVALDSSKGSFTEHARAAALAVDLAIAITSLAVLFCLTPRRNESRPRAIELAIPWASRRKGRTNAR